MNSHWSIKFFRSDYLLIEIVESAIFLFDQFFTIRSFEKIISSLKSSNSQFLSLFKQFVQSNLSNSIIFIEIIELKTSFFVNLIFITNQILESYNHLCLKIVEFANQIFFFILIMIEASFFQSSKTSFQVLSSKWQWQQSRASSSIKC
jgi:hypothetical protein